jgi:hypothetical protein
MKTEKPEFIGYSLFEILFPNELYPEEDEAVFPQEEELDEDFIASVWAGNRIVPPQPDEGEVPTDWQTIFAQRELDEVIDDVGEDRYPADIEDGGCDISAELQRTYHYAEYRVIITRPVRLWYGEDGSHCILAETGDIAYVPEGFRCIHTVEVA